MKRPPAFIAELVDVRPDYKTRAAVVHAALDVHDLPRFYLDVGFPIPPDADVEEGAEAPCLALLGCRRPEHPERDELVIAESALRTLTGLLRGGDLTDLAPLGIDIGDFLQALREHPDFANLGEDAP